jgi:MFS family permease
MWVAYLLNYTDRQVVFSIFPILKSELKFTGTELGLTGSIFLWVYAICSPIAGQIGDRFSKRALVVLSLAFVLSAQLFRRSRLLYGCSMLGCQTFSMRNSL